MARLVLIFSIFLLSSFSASASECELVPLWKRWSLKEIAIDERVLDTLGFGREFSAIEKGLEGVSSIQHVSTSSGYYYLGRTKQENYPIAMVRLNSSLEMNDYLFVRLPTVVSSWQEARAACKDIHTGGSTGWDLPLASDRFLMAGIPLTKADLSTKSTRVGDRFVWSSDRTKFNGAVNEDHSLFALWIRSKEEEVNESCFARNNHRAHVFALPDSAFHTFLPNAQFKLGVNDDGDCNIRETRSTSHVGEDTNIFIDRIRGVGKEEYYVSATEVDVSNQNFPNMNRTRVAAYLFNFLRHECNGKRNGWNYLEGEEVIERTSSGDISPAQAFKQLWDDNPSLQKASSFEKTSSGDCNAEGEISRIAFKKIASDYGEEMSPEEMDEALGSLVQQVVNAMDGVADWREFYPEDFRDTFHWFSDIAPTSNKLLKDVITGTKAIPVVCAKRIPKYSNCSSL